MNASIPLATSTLLVSESATGASKKVQAESLSVGVGVNGYRRNEEVAGELWHPLRSFRRHTLLLVADRRASSLGGLRHRLET